MKHHIRRGTYQCRMHCSHPMAINRMNLLLYQSPLYCVVHNTGGRFSCVAYFLLVCNTGGRFSCVAYFLLVWKTFRRPICIFALWRVNGEVIPLLDVFVNTREPSPCAQMFLSTQENRPLVFEMFPSTQENRPLVFLF